MQTPNFSAPRIALLLAACLVFATAPAHAVLLDYWDFNNDSRAFASGSPSVTGLFANSGGNGEVYDVNAKTLSSNNAVGAVFSNGSLSLSGVLGTYGGTTSATPSWGVYTEGSGNKLAGDGTTGGSLIIVNKSGDVDTLTFSLSTAGYAGITLSMASRASFANINGFSIAYSYSTDGGTSWTTLGSGDISGGPGFSGSWGVSTLSLAGAGNATTLLFQEIVTFGTNVGSYAIDNVQLNGSALAVPEPSTWALLLLGGGALVAGAVRRRSVA